MPDRARPDIVGKVTVAVLAIDVLQRDDYRRSMRRSELARGVCRGSQVVRYVPLRVSVDLKRREWPIFMTNSALAERYAFSQSRSGAQSLIESLATVQPANVQRQYL